MSEDEPFRYYDDDGNLHPDYVSCPTCNGQGYRDEYSGDPEHGGETCYHCYGHGYVHRTEEENRPIDDIMRDMANDPTKENAQAVRDYFTPKPEMEYDDDFQQKLTGSPMDLAFRLLKFRLPMKTNHRSVLPKPNMRRQTTLPEFAPNMSSPHGDVKWFHGTSSDRVGNIQTEGLKPNQGKVWVTGNRDVAENYAGGRSANRYIEEVMQPGGDLASPTQNPVTFGIREGAGSPKRHMGMESFDNTIKPEQLVRMPPTQKPANPAWHTGKSETGPSTGAQGQ